MVEMSRQPPSLLNVQRPRNGQAEDHAPRWTRSLAPLNQEEILLGHEQSGRAAALLPPGALGDLEEDDAQRHRWRRALWLDCPDDPDLARPDEIVPITVLEALEAAGEPWRKWALERTAMHLARLGASGRDPFSGELVDEHVERYRQAASALRAEALVANPDAAWLPRGMRRRRRRWRLIARWHAWRASRERWVRPPEGDPDDVEGLPSSDGVSATDLALSRLLDGPAAGRH
jgi:hypothetical protein